MIELGQKLDTLNFRARSISPHLVPSLASTDILRGCCNDLHLGTSSSLELLLRIFLPWLRIDIHTSHLSHSAMPGPLPSHTQTLKLTGAIRNATSYQHFMNLASSHILTTHCSCSCTNLPYEIMTLCKLLRAHAILPFLRTTTLLVPSCKFLNCFPSS